MPCLRNNFWHCVTRSMLQTNVNLGLGMSRRQDTSSQLGAFNTTVVLPNSMGILSGATLIAGLYFGRDALIPLALAILISFILTPVIIGFRKLGVRSPASVPIVMITLLAGLVVTGYVIAQQFTQFSDQLPYYEYNLREKVRAIKTLTKGDTLKRASKALESLEKELETDDEEAKKNGTIDSQNKTTAQDRPQAGTTDEPIKVKVETEPDGLFSWIQGYLASLVAPIASFAITLIFATFILLQREDLRDRVIRLFGVGDLTRTTNAMNDAATRLGKYFFAQFFINVTYGAAMAAVLSALGVPNAILWGFIAGLMRFVPYVGTLIAVTGPVLLALAVEPGWWLATLTLVIFLIAEFVMGQVVEPFVYGRNAGLSPLAVIASATFWTIIWGPIGLVLAVPITLILVTFGQYIEKLEFITVLLGNQPALTDDQKFYQRLLVGDHIELALQSEELFSEGETLLSYLDRVVIPGLVRAQREYRSGKLERTDMTEINQTLEAFLDLVREFSLPATTLSKSPVSEGDVATEEGEQSSTEAASEHLNDAGAGRALIVSGFGPIDESSARLVALVLEKMGFDVEVVVSARTAALQEVAHESKGEVIEFVVISTVSNLTQRSAQMLVRRLEQLSLASELLLCAWGGQSVDMSMPESKIKVAVTSFADLFSGIRRPESEQRVEMAAADTAAAESQVRNQPVEMP